MSFHALCDTWLERTEDNDDNQVQIRTSFYFLIENGQSFEKKFS